MVTLHPRLKAELMDVGLELAGLAGCARQEVLDTVQILTAITAQEQAHRSGTVHIHILGTSTGRDIFHTSTSTIDWDAVAVEDALRICYNRPCSRGQWARGPNIIITVNGGAEAADL